MLARHQRAPRRSAHGVAAIVDGQSHTFGGEPIDIRRADLLLPEASDVAITEIVAEEEDDVWALRFGGASFHLRDGCKKQRSEKQSCELQKSVSKFDSYGRHGRGPDETNPACGRNQWIWTEKLRAEKLRRLTIGFRRAAPFFCPKCFCLTLSVTI
jgi:hypothetical protein